MPWTKGILLFTMAVMILSSSLKAHPDAFSEPGAAYAAVSENTVRFGKLLIGDQDTVSNKNMKTSGLRSAKPHEARFHLAKTKLQRLSPSVQCSNDSMILRVPGPRMPHFLVDRGEKSPVPLAEMPANCGFSLKRVRRDVSLVAPYQGCYVRQQGGSYILPLIIIGAPVQMSCPVRSVLPAVSCYSFGMIVRFDVRADDVKVQVDGSWQPLLLQSTQCSFTLETTDDSLVVTAPFTGSCWQMTDTEWRLPLKYGDQEVTLSCPLTQPTVAPTTPAAQDPTNVPQMFDPFPFGGHWWYPPYYPARPTLPPTVPPTITPLQDPILQQMLPHMYPLPIFDPYFYFKGDSAAPPVPHPPQHPWYSKFPLMYAFQRPTEVTTTTPSPTQPEQPQGYPMYPPFYGYQPIKSFMPPAGNYPFMPQYTKDPVFGPSSGKSIVSSAQLSSIYQSRK